MENNLPSDVKKIVEPYLTKLYKWVDNGIQAYIENDSKRAEIFEKSTKCSMIRDYIKNEVIEGIDDDRENIQVKRKGNLFLFIIEQKYAIKIKKLNNNKMSVGTPTNQRKLFNTGAMEFPGFLERPKCLELGYIPDSFYLGSRGIYLTCRSEKWYFELTDAAEVINTPKPKVVKREKKRVKVIQDTKIIDINAARS